MVTSTTGTGVEDVREVIDEHREPTSEPPTSRRAWPPSSRSARPRFADDGLEVARFAPQRKDGVVDAGQLAPVEAVEAEAHVGERACGRGGGPPAVGRDLG